MNASVNFHTKFLREHMFSVLLAVYLGVELLDHMVIFMFNLWRNCQTVSHRLSHFTFSPAVYEGAGFSTSSPAACYQLTLILAILVGSHGSCDLHFPNWLSIF